MAADIKIYTSPTCGYCHAALRILSQKGVEFENIDVTGKPEIRTWLRKETGQHTVPQVFINDKSYGGYTDIAALNHQGELDALLAG